MTPFLTARAALGSLVVFIAVYSLIFAFGVYYIYLCCVPAQPDN